MLYEYALPRTKRLSWQWSFTPTMNYRKLTGDPNANIKSNLNNVPLALNIEGDPDKLVNHKPAMGFEIGTIRIEQKPGCTRRIAIQLFTIQYTGL